MPIRILVLLLLLPSSYSVKESADRLRVGRVTSPEKIKHLADVVMGDSSLFLSKLRHKLSGYTEFSPIDASRSFPIAQPSLLFEKRFEVVRPVSLSSHMRS